MRDAEPRCSPGTSKPGFCLGEGRRQHGRWAHRGNSHPDWHHANPRLESPDAISAKLFHYSDDRTGAKETLAGPSKRPELPATSDLFTRSGGESEVAKSWRGIGGRGKIVGFHPTAQIPGDSSRATVQLLLGDGLQGSPEAAWDSVACSQK